LILKNFSFLALVLQPNLCLVNHLDLQYTMFSQIQLYFRSFSREHKFDLVASLSCLTFFWQRKKIKISTQHIYKTIDSCHEQSVFNGSKVKNSFKKRCSHLLQASKQAETHTSKSGSKWKMKNSNILIMLYFIQLWVQMRCNSSETFMKSWKKNLLSGVILWKDLPFTLAFARRLIFNVINKNTQIMWKTL